MRKARSSGQSAQRDRREPSRASKKSKATRGKENETQMPEFDGAVLEQLSKIMQSRFGFCTTRELDLAVANMARRAAMNEATVWAIFSIPGGSSYS